MNVRVFPSNTRKVDTSDPAIGGIPALACDSAAKVAKKGVDFLCLAARLDKDSTPGGDYICSGTVDVVTPCTDGGPSDCCGPGFTETSTIDVACVPQSGNGGFIMHRAGGDDEFTVTRILPTRIQAVNMNTNAGNEYGPDLLPQYLTRVVPQGVNGVVTYTVHHAQGGQNPKNFQVNTTGLNDDAIHQAIKNGFEGLGLGLQAIKHCGMNDARVHSAAIEKFEQGCFVRVPNAQGQSVTRVHVSGLPGQDIVSEHNVPGAGVPVLSPWGIAILAALLLIGGWYLQRRRQVQTS